MRELKDCPVVEELLNLENNCSREEFKSIVERATKEELGEAILTAHSYIRTAIGVEEDAPFRFNYYVYEIEALKDGL